MPGVIVPCHNEAFLTTTSELSMDYENNLSQEAIQAALDWTHETIFLLRPNGRISYLNRTGCSKLQYSSLEISKMCLADLLKGADTSVNFAEMLLQKATNSPSFSIESDFLRKDGSTFPVEIVVRRIQVSSGLSFVLFARDTTRDRNAEAKLRGVFDNSRSFIGLMTTDGIVIDVNRTALAAAGVDAKDVLGKPFWETTWWSHSETLRNRLRESIRIAASGTRDSFEATHPTPDGREIQVDFSLSPIFSGNEVIYLIPEGRDITLRKVREKELANYLARLEDSNAQLEQFAYVASHDLRSPLTGIAQLAGFIREDDGENLSDTSLDYLDRLEIRVTRMRNLLNDLLTYSRTGRAHNIRETFSLTELLKDTIDMLNVPPGFRVEYPDDLPTIETLKTPLRQVFQNLIDNAIKHHDKAAGTIKISAVLDQATIEFAVADDGPGIAAEHHQEIFQMFKSIHRPGKHVGTGMGLAITRKIIKQMGNEIELESSPGNGTLFRFRWPLD